MSEKQINAVSRVDMESPNRLAQVAAQTQETSQRQVPERKAEGPSQEERILEQMSESLNQKLTPVNTSLKFQINDETNEITVLIIDKSTNKVLHTIPAEEINNLPAGNLMQYFV
jgi:flagellar protein FlaG